MSAAGSFQPLRLPEALRGQLDQYRRFVWRLKTAEAVAVAACGLLIAFLTLFLLDRLIETPRLVRWGLFAFALVAGGFVPLQLQRWVWRFRRAEQLARLLGMRQPRLGDQLLGVLELVRTPGEQARSPALCQAAVAQAARDASRYDFRTACPPSRHGLWLAFAAVATLATVAVAARFPAAARNAVARLAMPWNDIPRYTFVSLEPMPDRMVLPHGEPVEWQARLATDSRRYPPHAVADVAGHPTITAAAVTDGVYPLTLPGLMTPAELRLWVGDAFRRIRLEPMLRPELVSLEADISLPEYLGRPEPQRVDVRGGSLSLVRGATASLRATADRPLAEATFEQQPLRPQGPRISTPPVPVEGTHRLSLHWADEFGLQGREPLEFTLSARDDQPPTLVVDGLPRKKVVLDSEQLNFQTDARDDFGVRLVGIQWQPVTGDPLEPAAGGERRLATGDPRRERLQAAGTFSARSLGITDPVIELRVFVQDYLPDRPRVYSPPSLLVVMNPEQHAVWITEQLSKWHRQTLEVRDRERQLYENNKRLRDLPPGDLRRPEIRREIADQAAAERANSRRLNGLADAGDELLGQAAKNPEFGVGYLESWAEMLQALKEIAANRMPAVADHLADAEQAPSAGKPSSGSPTAGQIRSQDSAGGAAPDESESDADSMPKAPGLVDRESSMQPPDKNGAAPSPPKKPSQGALRLPGTTLAGPAPDGDDDAGPEAEPSAEESVEQAVREQRDLLAEFERLADEMERLLGNMEGTTLVKRLKAAARKQTGLADRAVGGLQQRFAPTPKDPTPDARGGDSRSPDAPGGDTAGQDRDGRPDPPGWAEALVSGHDRSVHDVSLIMDDMDAYFQRRRLVKFREILQEMRDEDVVGGLRQLGELATSDTGTAVALGEFWADTLDRWAEDLVDPSNCGQCPGGKSPASLPPSIVLEVLQIIEAETDLREETRVAEQARDPASPDSHRADAERLADTQKSLRRRVDQVFEDIAALPDGRQEFADELQLLAAVADVMSETESILREPQTGSPAIAAETEVIELLLQSRRVNPNGGGGGGRSPGGGGQGDTADAALALIGSGTNRREVRVERPVGQATGRAESGLPEEFREGLDAYFTGLERLGDSQPQPGGL